MGAVVTVRTRPGTDVEGLREKIKRALEEATGQQVNVSINVVPITKTPEVPEKIEIALPQLSQNQ